MPATSLASLPPCQARLKAPFAVLGISTNDKFVTGIDFLPLSTPILMPPKNSIAYLACVQLDAYLNNANFQFDLPIRIAGTAHQIKVWEALKTIPSGKTLSYGELATQVRSAPRAVGQACGKNPIPVVIPCHRVISASGGLGGFMGTEDSEPLSIKRWLLKHESYLI
ncbi:MAG: methylated-DNA--[protein]-cysteine S-methyltransferase [Pseudomonadota bacterium]